jgi:hypothetical protein
MQIPKKSKPEFLQKFAYEMPPHLNGRYELPGASQHRIIAFDTV